MEIVFGVTHGSVSRPLFRDVIPANLFFIIINLDFEIYADNNMSYITADNFDDLIKSLEEVSSAFFHWFDNNYLKINPGKCHLPINSNANITVKVDEFKFENSECERLLGVK